MKAIFGAGVVLSVLFAGSASAADMHVKAPILPPAFSWTSCYWGGNAGGAWTKSAVTYQQTGSYLIVSAPADLAFADTLGSPSFSQTGFIGGGQVGCNFQFNSLVLGIEGDGDFLHTSASSFASGTLPVAGTVNSSTVSASTDWLVTLRGRAGYAIDRSLFYVTGGLALGNEKFSQFFFHAASGTFEAGAVNNAVVGWTLGGGIEYAFTDWVSVKAEYLHVDLGTSDFNSMNNSPLFPTFTAFNSIRITENIARAGINFRLH